ncbi:MAG: histidinol-phosphate aminotransferase family protein [Clostridiales bacterium]|nr:histidinol-phosphate aminotransferase family protein [Clostridiales bacterium]
MAYTLNEKLRGLTPYDPGAGDYPVRLDANESFLTPPGWLRAKIAAALADVPYNRYPDPKAAALCAAFADYYGIDPAWVAAGNGLDEVLFILATCFTKAGDTLVTVAPDFSMYRFYGRLGECRLETYDKGEDCAVDPDGLVAFCREKKADMLLFSNPCNPTSLGLDREAVRKIIREAGCLVVLDEAYMDFSDQSLIQEADRYDNLILLRTCSKMLGLAGLRLGFFVANPLLTGAFRACKSPYNVNALSQAAGTVVLREKEYLDDCRRQAVASRDSLYAGLRPLCDRRGWRCFTPQTNFVFLKPQDAQTVHEGLKAAGILVRRMGGFLRITAGTEEENQKLLAALEKME